MFFFILCEMLLFKIFVLDMNIGFKGLLIMESIMFDYESIFESAILMSESKSQ